MTAVVIHFLMRSVKIIFISHNFFYRQILIVIWKVSAEVYETNRKKFKQNQQTTYSLSVCININSQAYSPERLNGLDSLSTKLDTEIIGIDF